MAWRHEQKRITPSSSGGGWRRASLALVMLALGLVFGSSLPGCQALGGGDGLLAGRTPNTSTGATNVAVLNDGVQAVDGDFWKSELTTVLRSSGAFVEYDLGQSRRIAAAYIQADGNDSYAIDGSQDGQTFAPIWEARPAGSGLRPRSTTQLQGEARYVRLRGVGGDGNYSVSELALFAEVPSTFPPDYPQRRGLPQPEALRSRILLFALAWVVWLFATWRDAPLSWKLGSLLLPIVAGIALFRTMYTGWPVEGREVALVRGVSAGVAALAVLREVLLPKRFPACRWVALSTLSVAALCAFAAFFNLFHPQFQDEKAHTPLFVHNFDMRVYYPVAKYFNELRFDGLYMASVAAMVDDVDGLTLDSPQVSRAELRNLRNHHMTRVSEIKDKIAEIPKRFTPQRWEAFKVDMRYFRETMGERDYLGSMRDHGGNATPVWLAIAHLIFMNTTASNSTLFAAALLDPLLLLIAFAAIGRVFGIRTMLVAVAVWGANDFYMFGSNWAGATLRHDWMAYLALGVCALKLKWWKTGGAFLALSALIRAFPALSLVGVAFPVLWHIADHRRTKGKFPTLHDLLKQHRPLLEVALGAVVCVVAFVAFSSLLFSFDSWTEWLAKVRLLDRDPHVNHISLRALVAGSGHLQHSILRARWPLFVAAIAVYAGTLVWLARGKRLDQGAVLGSMLIPVAFNPANYYIHYFFVIPLIAHEFRPKKRRKNPAPAISVWDAGLWGCLLLLCTAQYWTTLVKDTDLHFQMATVLYFAGTTAALAFLVLRDWPTLAGELQPATPRSRPAPRAMQKPEPSTADDQSRDGGNEGGDESGDGEAISSPPGGTEEVGAEDSADGEVHESPENVEDEQADRSDDKHQERGDENADDGSDDRNDSDDDKHQERGDENADDDQTS